MNSKLILALITLGFASAAFADDGSVTATAPVAPPSSQTDVTYDKDIKPIFDKTCIKCHGPEKPKAKLRLDSLAAVLKGGEDGKVVKPGKSADSMLVRNITHVGDPEDWMPPVKNRMGLKQLSPDQIALIRTWIEQGAK